MFTTELYQAITLVLVVLLVDLLERRRPGFGVDRRRELSLNLLALAVVIIGGELAKQVVLGSYELLDLEVFLPSAALQSLPSAVKIVLAVVLGDLSLYWVHRAMHRPLLWRTHAFHHSIPGDLVAGRIAHQPDPSAAVRRSPDPDRLLRDRPHSRSEAGIGFSFGVIVNVWIHTNIWVDLGPLEWLFITPNYHRIHHGARGYTDKNLAFVFTIWDRMFGTYVDPRDYREGFSRPRRPDPEPARPDDRGSLAAGRTDPMDGKAAGA